MMILNTQGHSKSLKSWGAPVIFFANFVTWTRKTVYAGRCDCGSLDRPWRPCFASHHDVGKRARGLFMGGSNGCMHVLPDGRLLVFCKLVFSNFSFLFTFLIFCDDAGCLDCMSM